MKTAVSISAELLSEIMQFLVPTRQRGNAVRTRQRNAAVFQTVRGTHPTLT